MLGQVVVVDNERGDNRLEHELDSLQDERIAYLPFDRNHGYSAAFNAGVAASRRDLLHVLAINNDAELQPGALEALSARLRANASLAFVAPRVLSPAGDEEPIERRLVPLLGYSGRRRPFGRIDFISWACVLVDKPFLAQVGGLDERCFMYWEDAAIALSAKRLGLGFEVVRDAAAIHERSVNRKRNADWIKFVHSWSLLCFADVQRGAWLIGSRLWLAGSWGRHILAGNWDTARTILAAVRTARTGGPAYLTLNPPGRRAHIKYYRSVRIAHLERLERAQHPQDLFYKQRLYDVSDTQLLRHPKARRGGVLLVLKAAVEPGRTVVIETAEPLTPSAVVDNLLLGWGVRILRWLGLFRGDLVAYAIENNDHLSDVRDRVPIVGSLVASAVRLAFREATRAYTRLCFGTHSAAANYDRILGDGWAARMGIDTTLILGLPKPAPAPLDLPFSDEASLPEVLFVGSLDDRKGIEFLMRAWDSSAELRSSTRLRILGKGPRAAAVCEWSRTRENTDFVEDPSRRVIAEAYPQARCLVLPSRRGFLWTEQIGLPIVEALASGTTIVASADGGLSRWLQANGHFVVTDVTDTDQLADAVLEAVRNGPLRDAVKGSLPAADGRDRAELWLARQSEPGS